MSRRGWLLFTAMGVIWGVPYLLIKVAVEDLSPASLVFLRTAAAALLLLPVAAATGAIAPLRRRWGWIVVFSAVEVAVPWLLLSDAERNVPSSLAGLLIAAVPIIGAVIAVVTGNDDHLDGRRAAGLLIGLVGVAALVGFDVSGSSLPAVGEIALVALGYAVGPVIIVRRLDGIPPVGVITASMVLTALGYAPIGIAQLPHHAPSGHVLLSVAGLGVLCTAVAFLLFFALIAEVGPVRATVITYVNPAVALALGVAVLGERFTLGAAVGFALILAGSFVATGRTSAARSPLAEQRAEGEALAPAPTAGVP